jgi:large subunit ribosomal protein L20
MSINAAVREYNIPYNRFINSLNKSNIELNRKILSEMARFEPYSFKSVVDEIKI